MANRIRGITVEIGGDVTKLDKALEETNKKLSSTQRQLKNVENALKIDPGNINLLAQKERLLGMEAEASSDKVQTLKQALDNVKPNDAIYAKWQKANASFTGEITKAQNAVAGFEKKAKELEKLGFAPDSSQVREFTDKAEAARKEIEKLQKAAKDTYAEMGRPVSWEQFGEMNVELVKAEDGMKRAKTAADNFHPALSRISGEADKVADKAGKLADATKGISLAAGTALTGLMGSVKGTEKFRTSLSMLETNATRAGVGLNSIDDALRQLNSVSDNTDDSVEALSSLLQSGVTESDLQRAVENLADAAISFPDTIKIDSLASSLQETLATGSATGQYAEVLKRLGLSTEEFNNQLAQVPGEVDKLHFALDTLQNQGLAGVYNSWKENEEALIANKDANLELKKSLSELAEKMQPLMTTVTELAGSFLDWFSGLSEGQRDAVVALLAITAAISPVAGAISSVSEAVSLVTQKYGKLKEGISKVLGLFQKDPMLLGVLAISAALAILILNWDKVKETVKNVIDAVVGFIEKGINAVKRFFGVLKDGEDSAGGGIRPANNPGGGTSPFSGEPTFPVDAPSPGGYPAFASGGVFAPNSPMLGVLGDHPTEYEVAAPESMLRDTFLDALSSSGLLGRGAAPSGNQPVILNMDGRTFARLFVPYLKAEYNRLGIDLLNR